MSLVNHNFEQFSGVIRQTGTDGKQNCLRKEDSGSASEKGEHQEE